MGSKWNLIAGEAGEQFAAGAGAGGPGAQRSLGPGDNRVDPTFEAERGHGAVVGCGRFEEESADQIVRDRVHPQFTLDDLRRESAEDIEREGGFDLAEVQFNLPALSVQLGNRAIGKLLAIEQRGGDHHRVRPKPPGVDHEANEADRQFAGQLAPELPGALLLPLGAAPALVRRADFPHRGFTSLVQSDDEIGSALPQQGEKHPATIGAVANEDLSGLEPAHQTPRELQVMSLAGVLHKREEPARVQTE